MSRLFFILLFLFFSNIYGQLNVWTGATDNSWHKACNWSFNTIPVFTDSVLIPPVTNDPTISAIAECKAIEIQTGAIVNLQSSLGGRLNIGIDVAETDLGGCAACVFEGTFTDARDGNVYGYVTIGSQVWMAENLRYLPSVNPPTAASSTAHRYYVMGYSGTNVATAKATANYTNYGVFYNWPAAMQSIPGFRINGNPSGHQGVCPAGWHLPSHAEWCELENFLASASCISVTTNSQDNIPIGHSFKQTGTSTWGVANGTNTTGFCAVGSGFKSGTNSSNNFSSEGSYSAFWSSTFMDAVDSWYRAVYNTTNNEFRDSQDRDYGFCVRCVQD